MKFWPLENLFYELKCNRTLNVEVTHFTNTDGCQTGLGCCTHSLLTILPKICLIH